MRLIQQRLSELMTIKYMYKDGRYKFKVSNKR